MTRTIEVEVDDSGMVRPTKPDRDSMMLSEASLSADWLRPEEDDAWAYMHR